MVPDYSLIIIGSNMGVSKMTREHLGVSLFLKIPFAIVLTKIDIAP
jgi:GTPase